ncbi:hypothetical protein Catovirus_1_284 [Catovirus CTV1]|uniref:Uncharacterized protein n=1 Tax=Catovirus CTV1 TaxID=1977631 RepID=A0A1V0S963_9VIRU|nr:hypothetical protein Catovirus_1_284 [Catovirus CTV1]
MYKEKYIKYKTKYNNAKKANERTDWYKYYTRSGIILYFNKLQDNGKLETYYILTEFKTNNRNIISEFGGERKDFSLSPEENATKYLTSLFPQNMLGQDDSTGLYDMIKEKKYTIIFNSIESENIYAYMFLINIGDFNFLRLNDKTIEFNFSNFQHMTENIVVIKKSYMTNIKTNIYPIIYDSLEKFASLFRSIKLLDYFELRDQQELSFKQSNAQIPECKTMDGMCNDFDVKKDYLNDGTTNTFACFPILGDSSTGIKYINIPKGYYFYKAMNRDAKNNDHFLNDYASTVTWYGDLLTAMTYVKWYAGIGKDFKVFPFKVERDLKLFYLMDSTNLELLYDIIVKKIWAAKSSYPQNLSNMYEKISKIKKLVKQLKYIKITTGYKMSWNEQLMEVDRLGLKKSIIKRKKNIDNPEDNISCKMNGTIFGKKYYELNRVSPTLKSDKYMMEAICENLNMDGYGVKQSPSLWHLNNKFNAEISVCLSRDLLTMDINNVYYNEKSMEYKDKMKLAEKRIQPIKTFDTIMIDIDTMFNLDESMKDHLDTIKSLYNKYHIVLFTNRSIKYIHEINKIMHPIEDYILNIIYDAYNDNYSFLDEATIIYSKNIQLITKYGKLVKTKF